MKSLFALTLFFIGLAAKAETLNLNGFYQLQSWTCADGTAPFSSDIIARIVGSTFMAIDQNKLTTTLKFDQGCQVSWHGQFNLTENTLALSEMMPTASAACHDVTSEKEPAISFTITSEMSTLTFFHAPSVGEPCTSGSVRVFKKLMTTKRIQ